MRGVGEEARTYAGSLKSIKDLEYVDTYYLFDAIIGDGTEVFSLMRDSELGAVDYVARYFQTGSERAQGFDPEQGEPEGTDVPEGR